MSKVNEKLAGYIRRNHLTNKFFADLVNAEIKGKPITGRAVENWRHYRSVPRGPAMEAIVKVTNGELLPNDFMRPEAMP